MLGDGSDVLGYDDEVSPDHDFGARVQLVLPVDIDPEPLVAALAQLPTGYGEHPVFYGSTSASNGWSEGQRRSAHRTNCSAPSSALTPLPVSD